ncbi:8048_t:CDS:2, partial [Funneliformis geosporum]
QVIELTDTSGIENFYSIAQYLTRTIPIVGAGLAVQGETQIGAIIAGTSLYADYLITRGKEKLFKSEEKNKKLVELNRDIENLYDHHEELLEILKPIRNSDSLEELNKLLNVLKEELTKIAQKSEDLTSILQTAVSEYKQGVFSKEIEEGIKDGMLKLKALQLYNELIALNKDSVPKSLNVNVEEAVNYLQNEIDKANEDKESEFEKEPLANTSNNSSVQLLKDKNALSTDNTSQSTNIFRKRTISNSEANESTNREVYEL